MNDTYSRTEASDVVKHGVVAFAIGAVVALFVLVISGITSMLARIPGLRMKAAARKDDEALVRSLQRATDIRPTLPDVPPVEGEVEELRRMVSVRLQGAGASAEIAAAMVHNRERLQYTPDQWLRLLGKVTTLEKEGVAELLLAFHLRLTLADPDMASVDLLGAMLEEKIHQHAVLRMALRTEGYGVDEFEWARRYHKVDQLAWPDAVRKSLAKVGG